MERGILLEKEGRTAVVLTPGGEFKRIPAPAGAHEIGDEVSFAAVRPVSWLRWGVAAAAAAIFLMAGGTFGYQTWAMAQPVALVSIDINPSIQLTLNKKEQVLQADAMNADGQAILQTIEWKRHSVSDVIASVTAKAVDAGKLNPADETSAVLVAVAPAKADDLAAPVADQIRSDAKEAVIASVNRKAEEHKVEAKTTVAAIQATGAERDEAAKAGLTPGKLLLLRELQAKKANVTPEQVKAEGPAAVLRQLGINPSDVLPQAEKDHGGEVQSHPGKSGEGNGKGKQDAVPTNASGPGDKGQGEKDHPKENGNAGNAQTGKPNGNAQDPGKSPAPDNKGNGNESNKNTGKETGTPPNKETGKGTDKANGNNKDKSSEDQAKKSSESDNAWHLPFGITVNKPEFLQKHPPETAETPRANTPGVEGPAQGQQGTEKSQGQQGNDKSQGQQGKEKSDAKGSQKSGH